ncbi:MAG: nitrate reductase associated protein [Microcoleus vaginatus WJT46-NPBG5]|jgi:hypothetical protein|nr:nitrate reductase associated protein [Microcoleus vaginatus WJT46-NPBG5]
MTEFFQFEEDFVESLRCIPMQVRLKLDTCGVKLKLPHWHKFNQEERQALVDHPCTTPADIQAYRDWLHDLVVKRTGTPASDLPVEENPAWMDEKTVPASVQEKAEECGVNLLPAQWASLTPLRRFALIKLSRSGHENNNFLPALKEFNLV